MALLFMDGFGVADSNFKWDIGSATLGVASASPRIPGGAYSTTGGATNNQMYKTIPASNKVIVGFGLFLAGNPFSITFYGDTGVTPHVSVTRSAVGRLEIRRGDPSGTILVTGTQTIFPSQWNYLEVSATISDTVGEVHVRLNGDTTDDVSFVGDTKNGGTATTIDRVYTNWPGLSRFADLYILDGTGSAPNNNFLGDVTVRILDVVGNGTYSQLTGSDGNSVDNYQLVDERPYSTTDYVGSTVVGQKDSYAISDLPASVTTVYGIQTNGLMAKTDATLGQARLLLRSGGGDYGGATRALTTTYTSYYDIHQADPATGVAWTPSGVNGIETGMEVM